MEQMFFMVIPIRIKIFKELKFYRKILIVMNYVKFSLNLYKQNLHYLVDANYTNLHSTKLDFWNETSLTLYCLIGLVLL